VTLQLATASGLSFDDASVELSGIAVQKCAEDGTAEWLEVDLEEPLVTLGETVLRLPELEVGAELCSLRVQPLAGLAVFGGMEVGSVVEHFVLELNIREMQFDFLTPQIVGEEGELSLVVQLAQAEWTSPDFIGIPPEPERGDLIELGPSDPRHSVLCQQVFRFSHVFLDSDGDGGLSFDETDTALSTAPVGGPGAMRTEPGIVALGSSRCLNTAGEEVDCGSPDVDRYSPALWVEAEAGASWELVETRPSFPSPVTLSDVAHDGAFFVAVGQTSSENAQDEVGAVMTSLAGVVWGGWLRGAPLHGVAKGAGTLPWVIVGAGCGRFHSPDGVVWIDNSCDQGVVVYRDVTWTHAGPSGGGMFVTVGDQGQWAWSEDGVSWVEGGSLSHPDSSGGPSGLLEIATLSDGRVVAVGVAGDIKILENPKELASANPIWTNLLALFGPDLTDVISYTSPDNDQEMVVAVGTQGGPILTVVDLAVDDGPLVDNYILETGQVQSLAVLANDRFVVGGDDGLWTWSGSPTALEPPVTLQEALVGDSIQKVLAYTPQ